MFTGLLQWKGFALSRSSVRTPTGHKARLWRVDQREALRTWLNFEQSQEGSRVSGVRLRPAALTFPSPTPPPVTPNPALDARPYWM